MMNFPRSVGTGKAIMIVRRPNNALYHLAVSDVLVTDVKAFTSIPRFHRETRLKERLEEPQKLYPKAGN